MATSAFLNRFILAVAAALLFLLRPPIAGADEACGSAGRLAVSLRFSEALFPELKDRELDVALSEGMGGFFTSASEADGFHLRFDKPTWHPPGETNEKSNVVLSGTMEKGGIGLPFYLYFSFIEIHPPSLWPRRLACHPVEFSSDAGHEQMRKAQEAIDPHPEWSDAQELEEARKLGLRYGPEAKDAVLQLIPLKDLSEFYGPLKITTAEFFINGGQKCAGCSFVLPRWEIKLSAPDNVRWLSITVEPFFGRITNLTTGE
jgi:hypothetical protein